MRADRVVGKRDATVSVEARRFTCDPVLRGRKVQVRYDPRHLESVLIFVDGKRFGQAFPRILGESPEPHPADEPERIAQSVDYLQLLRRDFDTKLLEHAKPLAYANLQLDPCFTVEDFVRIVCDLSGIDANPATRRELLTFWDQFGPLPEALVRTGTEHAIRMQGRNRHSRIYLHAIRTLVLAHWRGPGSNGASTVKDPS